MIALADIPTERLLVECDACRRRGAYRLKRLIERRGATFPLVSFLTEMRAACGRKPCEALLAVPLVLDPDRRPMESNLFTVDTWMGQYQHEMQVASVHNYDIAVATFQRAVVLWPDSIITIRHRAQIHRAHRPAEEKAREAQARIFRRLGLR